MFSQDDSSMPQNRFWCKTVLTTYTGLQQQSIRSDRLSEMVHSRGGMEGTEWKENLKEVRGERLRPGCRRQCPAPAAPPGSPPSPPGLTSSSPRCLAFSLVGGLLPRQSPGPQYSRSTLGPIPTLGHVPGPHLLMPHTEKPSKAHWNGARHVLAQVSKTYVCLLGGRVCSSSSGAQLLEKRIGGKISELS